MGTLRLIVWMCGRIYAGTAQGRHEEAARVSAGNLELLVRDQVARVSHTACTASPTTLPIQTECKMHIYTYVLCVMYI